MGTRRVASAMKLVAPCYTPDMLARRVCSLAWVLGLGSGCAPAADAPMAAPPPVAPAPMIDAAGDPDSESAAREADVGAAKLSAPEAIPAEINQHYVDQTDPAHWEERFEREGREVFDHRAEIIAALRLGPGDRVADVGAGSGLFTLAIARVVGEQGRVHAVDVQPYFLDHITQRARELRLGNVAVTRADQASVNLPEASVDLALMCDSYHHVEHPAAYLASLYRAIEPGGRLAIVDYAVGEDTRGWRREHVRATPAEFRAEIEAAGFRFVRAHDEFLEENFFFEFERP